MAKNKNNKAKKKTKDRSNVQSSQTEELVMEVAEEITPSKKKRK
ncbi:hypothetical protein [Candidatus Epulonipiscium viviparus]|nr:hypothetical protein [Candidatus Epulopiscium viviparus]